MACICPPVKFDDPLPKEDAQPVPFGDSLAKWIKLISSTLQIDISHAKYALPVGCYSCSAVTNLVLIRKGAEVRCIDCSVEWFDTPQDLSVHVTIAEAKNMDFYAILVR